MYSLTTFTVIVFKCIRDYPAVHIKSLERDSHMRRLGILIGKFELNP